MNFLKRAGAWLLAAALVCGVLPNAQAYHAAQIGLTNLISNGNEHFGIVDANGDLWAWGYNRFEQVAKDSPEFSPTPTKVMENVRSATFDDVYSAAIKKDGSLWTWGAAYCTLGHRDVQNNGPTKIMEDVSAVATSRKSAAAIKTDGSLWMWGLLPNTESNPADSSYARVEQYTPIKIMDSVSCVALGENVYAVVKADGSLWMWSDELLGKVILGVSSTSYLPVPTKVMDGVSSVALGDDCGAIIKTDGSLWMWGNNEYGQLGDGTTTDRVEPFKVMDHVASVELGSRRSVVGSSGPHTAAIKTDGSLWMWGSNTWGVLGNGTNEKALSPVKIMDQVQEVTTNDFMTGAIRSDGTVWVWGRNYEGMLGIGVGAGNKNDDKINYQDVPKQLSIVKTVGNQCTVTLNLSGGTGATSVQCEKGALLNPPNNPTREGYYFAGWYADSACVKPWNFDTDKVTDSITLYAKWEPKTTATVTAEPSTQKTVIDGKEMTFNTYILRDAAGNSVNFVKLRDVAYVLDGTAAQFNVDWRNNAIRLDAKQPYTTKNGAEMTVPSVVSAPARTSETPVLTGGVTAPLEAFLLTDKNGGGHNYFKLRDIGKVAGFNVTWDNAAQAIVITTTEPYSG